MHRCYVHTRLRCVFFLLRSQRHEAGIFLSTVRRIQFNSFCESLGSGFGLYIARVLSSLGAVPLHAEAIPNDDENPSNGSFSIHRDLSRCHLTASKTPYSEPWCRPTSISGDRSTVPRVRVRKNLEPTYTTSEILPPYMSKFVEWTLHVVDEYLTGIGMFMADRSC
jgi:hypothetical protein